MCVKKEDEEKSETKNDSDEVDFETVQKEQNE